MTHDRIQLLTLVMVCLNVVLFQVAVILWLVRLKRAERNIDKLDGILLGALEEITVLQSILNPPIPEGSYLCPDCGGIHQQERH